MKHIMERHDNELQEEVTELSKTQLKATLNENAKSAAFEQLKTTLLTHTKVKHTKYHHLEMQMYLKIDELSCEEIKTLTSFRSNCTRNIRSNFKKMFTNLECPLQCYCPTSQSDTPGHILEW